MTTDLSHDLKIELNCQGRNVIPFLDKGSIITIHGKNGVGKSMAATLLEVASGNHVFGSENQFRKLANIIESCEIQFKSGSTVLYKVILKPHLWSFDKNLNRIKPITLGKYIEKEKLQEKEIDFEDFKTKVYIRTIRGNESLQQQIFFFKDIFVAKLSDKLAKLEDKILFLENYQKWLNIEELEANNREYTHLQQTYNDILNKISNYGSSIRNREATLNNLKQRLELLNKLLVVSKYDINTLIKEKEIEKSKLESTKEKREITYKEIVSIKQKLDEFQNQIDVKTSNLLKELNKLRNKSEILKEQLITRFKFNLNSNKNWKYAKQLKDITDKIEDFQKEITKCKESIEKLNKENERIIEVNSYLTHLRDVCNKASSHDFGTEKLIKIQLNDKNHITLSFEELYEIFRNNNIEVKEDKALKNYKEKVKLLNEEINNYREKQNVLIEYNKVLEKIEQLDKELRHENLKIDSFIDMDARINALEKKQKEQQNIINNLDKEVLEYNQRIQEFDNLINDVQKNPSKSAIFNDLRNLGYKAESTKLNVENIQLEIAKVEDEVKDNQIELEKMKSNKESTNKRLDDVKVNYDNVSNAVKEIGRRMGFSQIGSFLDYILPHIKKLKTYIENTKKLQSRLKLLKDDIEKVIASSKSANRTHLAIINDQFDKTFKNLYNRKEFFEYVFKDYSKIKKFDISNRTIIFETKEGLEEARDLEEFSSGEKTYAYCRSIISMTANIAKYNIVILDESYALLDHEHSQDLYKFQEQMVQQNNITKFINILPLKENLGELTDIVKQNLIEEEKKDYALNLPYLKSQLNIIQAFQNEVNNRGYFQEIHFPKNMSRELFKSSFITRDFGKSLPPTSFTESDFDFSFILDGSNIARNNPNSKWASLKYIDKCMKKLMENNIPEKSILIIFGAGLRHYISEREKPYYEELLSRDNVNQAPAERNDDWFIIKYAMDHNSYIISNDRFLDYREKTPEYDKFITTHVIHYTSLGNDIIFDESFKEILKSIFGK